MMICLRRAMLAACAVSLASCASQMSSQDRQGFQAYLDQGDYASAASTARAAGQVTPDGQTKNVVWSLNAGSTMFDAGDMKGSVAVLDTTERLAQANDLNDLHAAIDYRYTTYDGVMTNVYKAMAFAAQGDAASARVELNRSEDRQRRAEEHFAKEIAAAQRQQGSARNNPQYTDMLAKAQGSAEYREASEHLSQLATYEPFENPFATYIAGVFFVSQGDTSKGMALLRRASQIMGPDSPATADLLWAEGAQKAAAGGRHARHAATTSAAPQTWVVFENGQSATYHELRLVLPMVTGVPMQLALPMLAPNAPALPALQVRAGTATASTAPAGSFDSVMASEFRRRQPSILAAAVAEVVIKNGLSVAAQRSNNAAFQLIAGIGAQISTADTRSWIALPKEFQATRVDAPSDGHLTLAAPDGTTLAQTTVPTDRPSIVWVKMQAPGARPAVQVLPL